MLADALETRRCSGCSPTLWMLADVLDAARRRSGCSPTLWMLADARRRLRETPETLRHAATLVLVSFRQTSLRH